MVRSLLYYGEGALARPGRFRLSRDAVPALCVAPLAKEEHGRPTASHAETEGSSVLSHA